MSYSPLNPEYTEDYIRSVLDGTFTKVDYEGRISTINVDADFAPADMKKGGRPLGAKIVKQAYWTPAEEELLIRQRMLNRTFPEIAWLLDRSVDATKKHYHLLRVKGLA